MLKYKEKFNYIIKKIINDQIFSTSLSNLNINDVLYNKFLNLLNTDKNDIIISNKIYYLLNIFIDLLKNLFLENGKIIFINSNLYYSSFFYNYLKDMSQFWLLGRYPHSYFSNSFYRFLYIKNEQKNNLYMNLPTTYNIYNKIIFILFYIQNIDNLIFLNEIKNFVNFLKLDFINISFIDIKNLPISYAWFNYENINDFIDISYMEFFFKILKFLIILNLKKKINKNYEMFFTLNLKYKKNLKKNLKKEKLKNIFNLIKFIFVKQKNNVKYYLKKKNKFKNILKNKYNIYFKNIFKFYFFFKNIVKLKIKNNKKKNKLLKINNLIYKTNIKKYKKYLLKFVLYKNYLNEIKKKNFLKKKIKFL